MYKYIKIYIPCLHLHLYTHLDISIVYACIHVFTVPVICTCTSIDSASELLVLCVFPTLLPFTETWAPRLAPPPVRLHRHPAAADVEPEAKQKTDEHVTIINLRSAQAEDYVDASRWKRACPLKDSLHSHLTVPNVHEGKRRFIGEARGRQD